MPAEPTSPDEFLEQWRASAVRHGLYFANHEGRSTKDLWACRLAATDRERLLLKSKRWEARGLHPASDGTWVGTYAAQLTVPLITVLARLAYDPDGPARCERFWNEIDNFDSSEHALPTHPGGVNSDVKAKQIVVEDEEGSVTSWVIGHTAAHPERMYSTTEQDNGNLCRLQSALRSQRMIPFAEDIKAFLELEGIRSIAPHELSLALGWDGRRVHQLLRGAWPSEAEAAQLLGLRQPQAILERLARQFPRRFVITSEPWPDVSRIDLGRIHRNELESPFAVEPDERNASTGYRRFSHDRLGQLANNLGDSGQPDLERFWLLVFLCDADAYGWKGQGFTGLRYHWTAAGPVPEHGGERLAALCADNVIRIVGTGARAIVKGHPFFYPPDLRIQHEADQLELRLPKDWVKLSHGALLEHCLARVDAAQAAVARDWLSYDAMLGAGVAP
ncbi:MAG: hypothetical protein WAT74_14755 [Flavobacteriales bacterium]